MAGGQRIRCQKCGEQFTRARGTSRLNCYTCKPMRSNLSYLPPSGGDAAETVDDQDLGPSLTDLTKKTLDENGILETWQGVAAIRLAQLIDTGKHGASGAAGTIKAHREAMAVALAIGEAEEADVIQMIFNEAT